MLKTVRGKIVFITLLMLLILGVLALIFAYRSCSENKILTIERCDLQVKFFAEKINKNIGIIEMNVLDIANAGHNPPLLKRANGKFEYLNVKSNLVLGALENVDFDSEKIELSKDDILLFYTDGVTESCNVDGKFFGEERLHQVINDIPVENVDVKDVVNSLTDKVDEFAINTEQADDITVLLYKYNGSDKKEVVEDDDLPVVTSLRIGAQMKNWSHVQNWLSEICKNDEAIQNMEMNLNLVVEEVFTNIAY